jgi:hypothetical protein
VVWWAIAIDLQTAVALQAQRRMQALCDPAGKGFSFDRYRGL